MNLDTIIKTQKRVVEDFRTYNEYTSTNPIRKTKSAADNAKTLDKNLSIFPRNLLRYPDRIEDHFFTPHVRNLRENLKATGKKIHRSINYKIAIICKSLYNRGVFINITVQELCASLKQHISQREKVVSKFKSETLITTEQFQKYGSSLHVQKVNEILKNVAENSERQKQRRTKQQAIDIRDYLMVSPVAARTVVQCCDS